MAGYEITQKALSRRTRQSVFLQWRRKRAKVEGAGIELAKSVLELPTANLPRHVARRPVVKDRPEGNCLTERAPRHSTKEEQRRVLGFDYECFQPARGDDAEIRIGHTSWSTTFFVDSKAAWCLRGICAPRTSAVR